MDAIKEINTQQTTAISEGIMQGIAIAINQSIGDLNNRLTEIYTDLKKTNDVQMRLKLAVPFINMLGVNLEAEFDIKSWAAKMYEKHKSKIFTLFQ